MSDRSVRSRRSLLKFGAGAATAFGLSNLAPTSWAASLNRSAVCLYLLGGSDSNNMIVPLDSPAYDSYAAGRGPLALPRNTLLRVYSSTAGGNFGFHPRLAGIQDLYNRGVLGVVANVGRAATPVNRAGVKSNPKARPADLFSHTNASLVRYLPNGHMTLSWAPADELAEPDAPSEQVSSTFPRTVAGRMLASVVNSLKLGAAAQQFFMCPLSGFDTHGNQLAREADLFAEMNDAVVAFYRSLEEMGIADRVTLFTQTEFNRTLAPNRSRGTEHGWSGHQLVLGKSVLGGQIHGRFPSLELGGPDDVGTTGIWIPSTSDLQFASTIGAWLGRTDLSSLPEFAGLREFAQTDLGFLAR